MDRCRTRIQAELQGPDDALVTVRGPVDAEGAARIDAVLGGLHAAGARWLVVDLTEAPTCDPTLSPVLDRAARRARAGEGCLVVDGARSPAPGLSLIEVFRMYRATQLAPAL